MRRGRVLDSISAVVLCVALVLPVQPIFSMPRSQRAVNPLADMLVRETQDTTVITVLGETAPTFTTFRLERPMRLFVDVAGGDVSAIEGSKNVRNGVIRSVSAQTAQRAGVRYGRITVTFERDALYHIRADGNAVVIVVDGSDRKLSQAQNAEIAAVREAAKSAAAREQQLLAKLRAIAEGEKQARAEQAKAESKQNAAVAEQTRLRAEIDRLRKAGHAAKKLAVLTARAKTLDSQSAAAGTRLDAAQTAMKLVQTEAAALRQKLREEQQSLADVVTQRRAEEARIALLRQQIQKERSAVVKQDKSRIAGLQSKLDSARLQAERLRKEAKSAQDVRRQAQSEEVARLKAEIARRDQVMKTQVSSAKQAQSEQAAQARREMTRLQSELQSSQQSLHKARRADAARDRAERLWRAAEARAQAMERKLAQREQELATAKKAMAEIARQQTESTRRAAQIGSLLQRREAELSAARTQLQARETALGKALAAAKERERVAIAAGKAREAKVAQRERARLETTRTKLDRRLKQQNATLEGLRGEVAANADARAAAEKQAATLRTALGEQQLQLSRLLAVKQQGIAASRESEQRIASLQGQMAKVRTQLKSQLKDRETQLDALELQLGKRVRAVQAELQRSQQTNASLSGELERARTLAQAREQQRQAAEQQRRAAEQQRQVAEQRGKAAEQRGKAAEQRAIRHAAEQAKAEQLAKEAMARAERVAALLKQREDELGATRNELRKRETTLASQLAAARANEKAARKAGKRGDAVRAAALRKSIEKERATLAKRINQHVKQLAAAQREAATSAKARARAEKEAAHLRSELQRREQALAKLSTDRANTAAASVAHTRKIAAAERELAHTRKQLMSRLAAQQSKLRDAEKTLQTRVAAARKELDTTRQRNQKLTAQLERAQSLANQREAEKLRAEQLAQEAMQRAKRVAQLLEQRERELTAVRGELGKREASLSAQLNEARTAERQARKSGDKREAAAAARMRTDLERKHKVLSTRVAAHETALRAARAEARASSEARGRAEKEAASLRRELAAREAKLAALTKRGRFKADQKAVQAAEAKVRGVRAQLLAQLAQRDEKLKGVEAQLQQKIEATRGELAAARKNSQRLSSELADARKTADHQRQALARANERAKRVAELLSERDSELRQVRSELADRAKVLDAELKRVTAREQAAKRAGDRHAAAAATKARQQMQRDIAQLEAQRQHQEGQARKASAEAAAAETARRQAEKQSAKLRAELQQRELALAKLSQKAARADELQAASRKVAQARDALQRKLAARDATLAKVEGTLRGQVADVRNELALARDRSRKLSTQLAAAQLGARQAAVREAAAKANADKIAKMLSTREQELRQTRDRLGRKEKELAQRLAEAKQREKSAREQGRSAEIGRATTLRRELESSLGSLRTDLNKSRSALQAAQSAAAREQQARQRSEARASKLAASLQTREHELSKLRAKSGADDEAVAQARARVAQARTALSKAARERDDAVAKMQSEVARRLSSAREEMRQREAQRSAELRSAHKHSLALARVHGVELQRQRKTRHAEVAALYAQRERELTNLTEQLKDELGVLTSAQKNVKKRVAVASKKRRGVEKRALVGELKLIQKRATTVRKQIAARRADIARAQKAARVARVNNVAADRKLATLLKAFNSRAKDLHELRVAARPNAAKLRSARHAFDSSRRELQAYDERDAAGQGSAAAKLRADIDQVRSGVDRAYASREAATNARYAHREKAMQAALSARPTRVASSTVANSSVAARSAATKAGGADKPRLDHFVRKQQLRIAVLEARAQREQEARSHAKAQAETQRLRAETLAQKLAAAKTGQASAAKASVAAAAAARTARAASDARARQLVAEARRREQERSDARSQVESRRRMRAEAALERMRSRQQARSEASAGDAKDEATEKSARTRILDLKITAEGRRRGRVALPLTGDPQYEVVSRKNGRLVLRIRNARLPQRLQRVYDTRRLDSPIARVTAYTPPNNPNEARVEVDLNGQTSNVVSVAAGKLVWDFVRTDRPQTARWDVDNRVPVGGDMRARTPQPRMQQFGSGGGGRGAGVNSNPIRTPWRNNRRYTGKRINLTIKDADIHHVLTFLAKEGNVNIVAGSEVTGKVTFHLENIPWDLALDVILRARSLDYVRQSGVIRVSTIEALKNEFNEEVARRKAVQEVKQLVVRIIPVNYGQAINLRTQVQEIKSTRGSVTVDPRTNALVVKDTEEHVAAIEEMIRKLDSQTPQVLVEARIVEASSNFTKDVGIQWGGNMAAASVYGNETGLAFPSVVGIAGGADGGQANAQGVAISVPNYAVNMPAAVGSGTGGAIGLTLGSLGGAANLNLRLSAAEQEGTVKIVSSPKVLTLDNREARIRQGISIPISVVSAQGVQTRFFDADLRLTATPHITQDGNIMMQVQITKNEPDFSNRAADGNPTITQREARTELLLGDGETTVIGGIYTRSSSVSIKKVPFFGDLPLLGGLFRSRATEDKRSELLIFITPRIVNRAQSMTVGK